LILLNAGPAGLWSTTLMRSKDGRFAIRAQAPPGNPYDGHTLARVIPAIEHTVGNKIDGSGSES
jgi:transposase, IS5 family